MTRIDQIVWWSNVALEVALVLSAHPGASDHLPDNWADRLIHHTASHTYTVPSTAWLLGTLFITSGSLLRLSCFRALGSLFTFELAVKDDHRLVTTGPYAYVRHPSYLGSMLVGVGRVLLLCTPGSWIRDVGYLGTATGLAAAVAYASFAVGIPAMLWARASTEDQMMKHQFGQEWEAYAKRTPYRLLPFIY